MSPEELRALLDTVTVEYHDMRRSALYQTSGNLARDLAALRAQVDAWRASAGLGPSPVLATWAGEEDGDV